MTSKLDYLKRYTSSSDDAPKKKRKKPRTQQGNKGLKVVDEDISWDTLVPSSDAVEQAWDEQGEENRPVTVELDSDNKVVRGQWTVVDDSDQKPSHRHSRHDSDNDASPPRRRRHDSDNDASPPRRRRHDSDNDASPPRRRRHDSDNDASPPRRRRHDSDNDASPPRRRRHDSDNDASPPRRRRHDSDNDASPPRRRRHDSDNDASPPRRRRHDSDNDASPPRRRRHDSDNDASPPRRRRHDSDNDDASPPRRRRHDSDNDASPPRRRRHDSDNNASPPRRRRHDSDNDASPPRRRRHDSDNDASPPRRRRHDSDNDASPPRRRRHDSDNDASPPRRRRHDSDNDASPRRARELGKRSTTASGHSSGLQTASAFGERERDLKEKRDKELKQSAKGQSQPETVYRDKRGRKLDMLNEFMRQQAARDGKEVKMEKAQFEWGKGIVQKESAAETARELEAIANEPFARTIDDPRLEEHKRKLIRDGDPMAEYFAAKQAEKEKDVVKKSGKPAKPIYRGPAPPPNRFHIRPGYRWDAIDRGNQFETKLLKKISDKGSLKEDEYKWSVSDM